MCPLVHQSPLGLPRTADPANPDAPSERAAHVSTEIMVPRSPDLYFSQVAVSSESMSAMSARADESVADEARSRWECRRNVGGRERPALETPTLVGRVGRPGDVLDVRHVAGRHPLAPTLTLPAPGMHARLPALGTAARADS